MGRLGRARSRDPAARGGAAPAARHATGAGARSSAPSAAASPSGAGAPWRRPRPCCWPWPRRSRGRARPPPRRSRPRAGSSPGSRARPGRRRASCGRPASRVGEWIDTREGRARLSVGEIGEVRLEPATRVGLLDAGERSHRLSLARGVMHAMIWAPPGQFLVDTPSAVAVDLGCSYTLEVAEDGSGLLRVETGWVGFESRGLQSLVPAGAACPTRRGVGPGTPYFETAPEALRRALAEIDFGSDGAREARRPRARARRGPRARRALAVAPAVACRRRGSRARLRSPRRARAAAGRGHARGHPARRPRHARRVVGRAGPRLGGLLAGLDGPVERPESRRLRSRAAGPLTPGGARGVYLHEPIPWRLTMNSRLGRTLVVSLLALSPAAAQAGLAAHLLPHADRRRPLARLGIRERLEHAEPRLRSRAARRGHGGPPRPPDPRPRPHGDAAARGDLRLAERRRREAPLRRPARPRRGHEWREGRPARAVRPRLRGRGMARGRTHGRGEVPGHRPLGRRLRARPPGARPPAAPTRRWSTRRPS